jgi:hypothetical protein
MEEQSSKQKKMDKNRKISLIFLSVFSVAIIAFAFLNLNNTLRSPFESRLGHGSKTDRTVCVDGYCFPEGVLEGDFSGLDTTTRKPENLDLKLIDTDGDGISDWDELFIYGTSPYLANTSGDGISDYDAIFVHGIDPLCPQGEDCYGDSHQYDLEAGGGLVDPSDFLGEEMNNLNLLLESFADVDEDLLEELLEDDDYSVDDIPEELRPDQVRPDDLRKMLLDGGLSQEDVDQLSDEDLINLYQESFSDF